MEEEKTEQQVLDQMADEQEMLEFFMERHKSEIELTKMKMFHAFQRYCERLQEVYTNKTKDMTPEEKEEYDMDVESGEEVDEWEGICTTILGEVEKEYNYQIDIDHDDMDITITAFINYFYITCNATVYDSKKKMSEFEFEVELNDKAHFMIDLTNKLILNYRED